MSAAACPPLYSPWPEEGLSALPSLAGLATLLGTTLRRVPERAADQTPVPAPLPGERAGARAAAPAQPGARPAGHASQPGQAGQVSHVSQVDLEQERLEVERAKVGDRAALAVLLRRYGPQLYRSVLLPRLGSQPAAEEALSQTYTKVIERLDQFTWQGVGIYPWLRMVAMRIALDILRAKRREVPFDVDDLSREVERAEAQAGRETADATTIARQDADAARARVDRALDTIHPRYAKAIRMRILEERSRDEVARELGVTVATFDVVLHRAMAALRKALGPEIEEGA